MIWISPHLDDAVLSAGEQIAADPDAMVITVFAGIPGIHPVTNYDVSCGFRNAEEAVKARRQEDVRACSVLGAADVHLGFLDAQYNDSPSPLALVEEIQDHVGDDESGMALACPLALLHEDHVRVSDAVIKVAKRMGRRLFLWEDAPSRVTHPESVPVRIEYLQRNHDLTFHARHPAPGDVELKEKAIWCYRSQIRVGLPWRSALGTERLWEVTWP